MKILILISFFLNFAFPQNNSVFLKSKLFERLEFKFGSSEELNYDVNTVNSLCVDKESNIYLLDGVDCCIKKYDRQGKFIKWFGREGSGPGEFIRPFILRYDEKNNHLIISDIGNQKISIFTTDGEFRNSTIVNKMIFRLEIDSEANLYIESRDIRIIEGEQKSGYRIDKYTDEIKYLKNIDKGVIDDFQIIKLKYPTLVPAPFPVTNLWKILPNNELVVNYGEGNLFKIFTVDGKVKKEIKLPEIKALVRDDDKENYLSIIKLMFREENLYSRVKNKIEIPKYKPGIHLLFSNESAHIIFLTNEITENYRSCYVYDSDGEFLNKTLINKKLLPQNSILIKNKVYQIMETAEDETEFHKYILN